MSEVSQCKVLQTWKLFHFSIQSPSWLCLLLASGVISGLLYNAIFCLCQFIFWYEKQLTYHSALQLHGLLPEFRPAQQCSKQIQLILFVASSPQWLFSVQTCKIYLFVPAAVNQSLSRPLCCQILSIVAAAGHNFENQFGSFLNLRINLDVS
jgi:hypothetical protein